MRVLGYLLLFVCLGVQAQNEVYKWVDADGRIQYGDAPPKGVNAKPVSGGVTVMPAFKAPPVPNAAKKPKAEERPAPDAAESVKSGSSASESSALSPEEAKRLKLLEACRKNRGANCEEEVETQLRGADTTVFVPIPGWSQPPIQPTPPQQVRTPVKPAPAPKEKILESRRNAGSSSSARREDR